VLDLGVTPWSCQTCIYNYCIYNSQRIQPRGSPCKTGLELLQAMLRGELPFPPIAEALDFSLISVEAGHGSAARNRQRRTQRAAELLATT
jgi:hypothetical protein